MDVRKAKVQYLWQMELRNLRIALEQLRHDDCLFGDECVCYPVIDAGAKVLNKWTIK